MAQIFVENKKKTHLDEYKKIIIERQKKYYRKYNKYALYRKIFE